MLTVHHALGIDVVRFALEAACPTPDHTVWYEYAWIERVAWFASTLRVSRTWYIAGQHALYRRIYIFIQREWSNKLLLRTLSRKPHIARMVRMLHIQSLLDDTQFYGRVVCRYPAFIWPSPPKIPLSIPSIPFVTEEGRRVRRGRRQHRQLVQLLSLCVCMTDLSLDAQSLTMLIHVLDSVGSGIERLAIQYAHTVSHNQWEDLTRLSFWRNLRAIRLDATDPVEFDMGALGLDVAFLGGERYTCFEELEIIGSTSAEDLCTMIELVRSTLKTLRCFQPEHSSRIWLSLASSQLETLVLTLRTFALPIDLNLLTRLKSLTITLCPTFTKNSGSVTLIPLQHLPPFISIFEVHVADKFDPWCAASHVAQVLRAFDLGLLPNLGCIIVTVNITAPRRLAQWNSAAFLLTSVIKRRGLQFRLDVRFDLCHHDLYRSNRFQRMRYEWWQATKEPRWATLTASGGRIVAKTFSCFYCATYILLLLIYRPFEAAFKAVVQYFK